MLEVAKVDAGVLTPVNTEFNVSSCIEDVVSMLRPLVEKKNLKIISKISGECSIIADRRFIRQILINLVNNSIKFTHHGSITIKQTEEGDFCRIDVIDTGIGISEAEQKMIFKDFHRVEKGMTQNYEGVGLGLTLSKRLVELHNGRITVESEFGSGSTFSVFLPKNNIKGVVKVDEN